MKYAVPLKGVIPAILTPFTQDGEAIDRDALSVQVERLIGAGVAGLIAGGSSGEFATLSLDEREFLHESVVRLAAGRVPVIAQTGATRTADSVRLSRHAESVGAAAIMVAPPYYGVHPFRNLLAYFSEIAATVNVPVMIYHIPGSTGQKLTIEQIGELARIPNVESIKDSSGDVVFQVQLQEQLGDRVQVGVGWDSIALHGFAYGLQFWLPGAPNVLPDLSVELFNAIAVDGDLERGRKIWAKLAPVVSILERQAYPAGCKAACEILGVPMGPVRAPLLPLDNGTREELREALALLDPQ